MGITHHKALSTSESGYYYGGKGAEVPMYNQGMVRFDSGQQGFSGQVLSVSTSTSSISQVVANFNGVITSGKATVRTASSGHTFDLYTHAQAGGAASSSTINWMAIGT